MRWWIDSSEFPTEVEVAFQHINGDCVLEAVQYEVANPPEIRIETDLQLGFELSVSVSLAFEPASTLVIADDISVELRLNRFRPVVL